VLDIPRIRVLRSHEDASIGVKRGSLIGLLASLAACSGPSPPADPIPEVPLAQQRTIARSELGFRWPFTVGQGTLGCVSGAVIFQNGGRRYAVNDAAKPHATAGIESIQAFLSGGPPTNPLGRIRQEERQRIFAACAACGDRPQQADACRKALRDHERLSDDELKQVEAEGQERRWPPLAPQRTSLDAVVEAGLRLCRQ
jgi:hypothetical protein